MIEEVKNLKDLTCVILCGGKSSRMGEDKALLPLGEFSTLAQYQYERLKPYFKKVYLSSKIDKFDFLEDKSSLILDVGEVFSPLVALQTIFKTLENEKQIFILTVDNPFVTLKTIQTLYENTQDKDVTIAKSIKTHSLCGVFNTSCINKINDMIEEDMHKIGFLVKSLKNKTIEFEDDEEFLNLNEKSDYKKALLK